jgi:diguanylate cyclase (GGDEF)-like protein/PAS domain S-box-containing protein
MPTVSVIAIILTLIGALFMGAAVLRGRTAIYPRVPPEFLRRWRILVMFMVSFLAGYLLLILILSGRIFFPIEAVTGIVFLGGAVFVFIIINLSSETIKKLSSTEEDLRRLNDSLERRVAERTQELQSSQIFLKTVLHNLHDEVMIIDPFDHRIVDANASFLSTYNLKSDTVIGQTCYEITHRQTDVCCSPDTCPLSETLTTGKYAVAEHTHTDREKNKLYVEISTTPICDPDGRITQIIHITHDITARKRAEQVLRENEEQLQHVLDSIHAGIIISDPANRQIVDANAFAAAMIGAPQKTIIGRTSSHLVSPAERSATATEEPRGAVENAEWLLRKSDGSTAPILMSAVPIHYRGKEHLLKSFIDISGRKTVEIRLQRAMMALRESEERYRQLVELSPDGIGISVDGKYVFMNDAGLNILRASHEDQIIGTAVLDILTPEFRSAVHQRLEQMLTNETHAPWLEEKYIRFDGTTIDVEVTGVPFTYEGEPAVQTIFRDISERKHIEERLKQVALYDELTGLPNRSLFSDRMRQMLELAKRNCFVLMVLYIDLDRFKQVNDTHGHEVGDLLLKEVSRRLLSAIRKSDTIARVGGDEFVGICGKIEHPDDTKIVAQKIVDVLTTPFSLKGHISSIGASIGVALYPEDGDDAETLVKKADAAMYKVKQSRQGGYAFYRDLVITKEETISD